MSFLMGFRDSPWRGDTKIPETFFCTFESQYYSVLKVLGMKRIHNITTHITPVTLIALVTCCDLFLRTHLSVLEFTSCIFAGNHQPVIETIRVSERLVVVVSKSYLLWTRWEWEIRWFVLWSIFKRKLHRPVKFTTHHHPPPPPLATESA